MFIEEDDVTQVGGGSPNGGSLTTICDGEAEQGLETVCVRGFCFVLMNSALINISGAAPHQALRPNPEDDS